MLAGHETSKGVLFTLPTPSQAEVADVARRTAERLARAFKAEGRPSPWDEADAGEPDPEPLSLEQPGLFACYDAAARGLSVSGERAGQPALRLVVGGVAGAAARGSQSAPCAEVDEPVAEALGVRVACHANHQQGMSTPSNWSMDGIESSSNDSRATSPARRSRRTASRYAPMVAWS